MNKNYNAESHTFFNSLSEKAILLCICQLSIDRTNFIVYNHRLKDFTRTTYGKVRVILYVFKTFNKKTIVIC